MGHGHTKICDFFGRKGWGRTVFTGVSICRSLGGNQRGPLLFGSVMPAVLLVVWKSVFVSKVNRKKCREEAKKCFLLLIHHFVALCGRMDQVCQADQGINQ